MEESTTTVRQPGTGGPPVRPRLQLLLPQPGGGVSRAPPLTKEGFERGEKVFHIVDPEQRPERMRRLEEVGISPAAARRPGQVEIRAWEDAHLRGGRFDKEAMMTLLEETLRGREGPTASADSGVG